MNLALLDPFQKSTPDRVETTLEWKPESNSISSAKPNLTDDLFSSSSSAFNNRGTYLAVGYTSNTVVFWDLLSRNDVQAVTNVFTPPPISNPTSASTSASASASASAASDDFKDGDTVVSLSWSRHSRFLLCTSDLGSTVVLDLRGGVSPAPPHNLTRCEGETDPKNQINITKLTPPHPTSPHLTPPHPTSPHLTPPHPFI